MSDDPSMPFRSYSHHIPSHGDVKLHLTSSPDDSSVGMKSRGFNGDLPKSVKHAPAELRAAIRRRQNNEASKRSRDKQRAEMEMMEKKYNENETRLKLLEKQVEELSAELSTRTHRNNGGGSSRRDGYYGEPF